MSDLRGIQCGLSYIIVQIATMCKNLLLGPTSTPGKIVATITRLISILYTYNMFSTGAGYAIYHITIMVLFYYTIVSSKSVYYVRPDDEGFSSNNSPSAHTLNYYLLNASTYITSDTELKFLPGVYQLKAVIKIRDAHHFSVTGSLINGAVNSVVECSLYSAGGMVIINSSYIDIKNLVFKNCEIGANLHHYISSTSYTSILVNNSYFLDIHHVTTLLIFSYNIVLINVFNLSLDSVASNGMAVIYTDNHLVMKNNNGNKLFLHNYTSIIYDSYGFTPPYEMVLNFMDYSSEVQILISNVKFKTEKALLIRSQACCVGTNEIVFSGCSFDNIRCVITLNEQNSIIAILIKNDWCKFSTKQRNLITFINCSFSNNVNYATPNIKYVIKFINVFSESLLYIKSSKFCCNNGTEILSAPYLFSGKDLSVIIQNVTFSQLTNIDYVIFVYNAKVILKGPVIFSDIGINSAVIWAKNIHLVFSDYIEFSDINAFNIIVSAGHVYLNPNTCIQLTSNIVKNAIFGNIYHENDNSSAYARPCIIQYISNNSLNYHRDLININNYNISIIINKTVFAKLCENKYCTAHCSWASGAMFEAFNPLLVNKQIIRFVDQKDAKTISSKKGVCYCTDNDSYNCYLDEINVYPGQTANLYLISTFTSVTFLTVTVNTTMTTSCRVIKNSELEQRVYNNCTSVYFTIHYYKKWCELFLSLS